ncbi:MAG: T9SS-dependent M36 family metallopeptidase, partial [Flavobacteriales bacterium]|nr:T9SS-dependent M36 family metallopeptidase [Flavobacteriales bacterium]
VKLAWDLSIHELSGNHWWSIRIDALTGQEINKGDWVTSCKFDSDGHNHNSASSESHFKDEIPSESKMMLPAPPPATNSYRVFAIPTESPNHGPRTLVVGPSDATASPYGWHNISGAGGSEFTITTGNNVRAWEDEDGNDGIGYWPDAGAPLIFDYPLDLNQAANQYWDASITNLFYMNNIMHDVWYHYGFDEASGNFQANNYGAPSGISSDQVYAEAQDGSGTNNANFSTPPDGQNPTMQMYLWDTPADLLTINTPAGIAGTYAALPAAFGAPVPTTPLISDLVLYDDNTGVDFNDACEDPVNGAEINGNICVIRRGDCFFSDKILKAEAAGATAVIMVNNVNTGVISMGDGGTGTGITIPAIFISKADGDLIIAMIESGTTVNGTIDQTVSIPVDGDLDNGIIAHEYGHGISTRLTGGAANSGCLGNLEQMGEGWSDWFGLMLTIEPGDQATDVRGIGTFASSQGTNGIGIRPAPYSTDFAVNDYTYDATNWDGNTGPETISEPHGIGFVWCTMLWDMTWALIDNYGYDADLYNGTGGNNIAMELVIQALKLQPCDPGFVDGRDAILQADMLLNGGANQCLIWNVFANRGLGNSALQGNPNSRSDQTEAFDMPPGFVNVSGSESITSCIDYTWSANGTTYTSNGNYVETLLSSNGCDSIATLNLTILNPTTSSSAVTACETYNWNGMDYTTSGVYTWTGTNSLLCDSVATLNLTIDSAPSANISSFTDPTTCSGLEGTITIGAIGTGIISWAGPTSGNSGTVATPYTISGLGSGNYSITFDNGCPSNVLNQGLISPGATASDVSVTECNTYNWNGVDYTSSGIYSWTGTNAILCDSVATLNLTINNPTVSNSTVTECDNYNWNGTDYITSGTYTWAGTNAAGCDSTANLNLIINNVDVSTSFVDDFTMTSDIAGAAYAWIDCNDNNSLIDGATNQAYTATYNGEFAVIVTESGCSDTSACMTVSTIGIVENNFGTDINVYPNPTSQDVTIDLGAEYSNIEIRVTNALGQIIDSKLINASNSIDITLDGASGTYILEITTDNDVTARVRVVKQ